MTQEIIDSLYNNKEITLSHKLNLEFNLVKEDLKGTGRMNPLFTHDLIPQIMTQYDAVLLVIRNSDRALTAKEITKQVEVDGFYDFNNGRRSSPENAVGARLVELCKEQLVERQKVDKLYRYSWKVN